MTTNAPLSIHGMLRYSYLDGNPDLADAYEELADIDILNAIDRKDGVITPNEFKHLSKAEQQRVLELQKTFANYMPISVYSDRAHRTVLGGQLILSDDTDPRTLTAEGTYKSEHNLMEPIFSDAVGTYSKALGHPVDLQATHSVRTKAMFEKGTGFHAFRAYGMEKVEDAERLIQAAKAGLPTIVAMNPNAKAVHPESQQAFKTLIEEAAQTVEHLHLIEVPLLNSVGDYGQIQHDKQHFTVSPEGIVACLQGGINYGNNSNNNMDLGDYTEGVAARDELQFFIRSLPYEAKLIFNTIDIPSYKDIVERVETKRKKIKNGSVPQTAISKTLEYCPIEVAGAGASLVPAGQLYHHSNDQQFQALQELAAKGHRIDIKVEALLKDPNQPPPPRTQSKVIQLLTKAIENPAGTSVKLWLSDLFDEKLGIDAESAVPEVLELWLKAVAKGVEVTFVAPPASGITRIKNILAYEALAPHREKFSIEFLDFHAETLEILATAVPNGSHISVTYPAGHRPSERSGWIGEIKRYSNGVRHTHKDGKTRTFEPLKPVSVHRADRVIYDESYKRMVLRELDDAIANGDSIHIGAFAFTNSEVQRKLIEAKQAGCLVEVMVHDLDINNNLINQATIVRLRQANVDLRIFNYAQFEEEITWTEYKELVKLHSKLAVFGMQSTKRAENEKQPRYINGSANFSNSGFKYNYESGRLVETSIATQNIYDIFFKPIFDKAFKPAKLEFVPPNLRPDMARWATPDTKFTETVYIGFDLESDRFTAHTDGLINSKAGYCFTVNEDGEVQKIEGTDFSFYYLLPKDYLGRTRTVPDNVFQVTGIQYNSETGRPYQYEELPPDPNQPSGRRKFGNPTKILTKKEIEAGEGTEKQIELGEAIHLNESQKRIKEVLDIAQQKTGFPVAAVGHWANNFDIPFSNTNYARKDLQVEADGEKISYNFDPIVLDTVAGGMFTIPEGETDGYGLDEQARYFLGLEPRGQHFAKVDADIVNRIFPKQVEILLQQGLDTLAGFPSADRLHFRADPQTGQSSYSYKLGDTNTAADELREAKLVIVDGGDLRIQYQRNGKWSDPIKVTRHDVLGFEPEKGYRVKITTGQTEYMGYMDPLEVATLTPGRFFYEARQHYAQQGIKIYSAGRYREMWYDNTAFQHVYRD